MSDQAGEFSTPDRPPFWYGDGEVAVVDVLNQIIAINRDGAEGYETAAKDTDDVAAKKLFTELSQQRARNVANLSGVVVRHGGHPQESGNLGGVLHRMWMDLKGAVDDEAGSLIEECLRGEEVAVKAYKAALKQDLPRDAAEELQHQLSEVQAVRHQLEALR